MTIRKYGWKPDLPDHRDIICDLKIKKGAPKTVDLRTSGNLPFVYDQGPTSSCTGNAIAAAIQYGLKCQSKDPFLPSRLFIYYNERLMEGTINDPDAGAMIRDGIKSVAKQGVCPETYWPFDLNRVVEKPDLNAYNQAQRSIIKQYSRVPVKLANIQNVLIHNIPIVFGMTLYGSFMENSVALNGIVPMPSSTDSIVGGHAMLIVGFDDKNFIVRNSWGEGWGDKGYCYIPHEYLTNENLADDFWAIFLS